MRRGDLDPYPSPTTAVDLPAIRCGSVHACSGCMQTIYGAEPTVTTLIPIGDSPCTIDPDFTAKIKCRRAPATVCLRRDPELGIKYP